MSQTNPISIFRVLLGFRSVKGKAKFDAIEELNAVAQASEEIGTNIVAKAHATVSELQFLENKTRAAVAKAKYAVKKSRSLNTKLKSIGLKRTIDILTNNYTSEAKFLVTEAEDIAINAKANDKTTRILTRKSKAYANELSIAVKYKSYADGMFVKACRSMTNPRKNNIVYAIANAVAISMANTYVNVRVNYALSKWNSMIKFSTEACINISLDEIPDHLIPHRKTQIQFKQGALDVTLIRAITQGLAEVFPEEWGDWQHWISDMMDSRTRMQSKGMNHRLVSLITFYRLTRFVFHIGIDKVFILATRRATR
jgi:hypothetical protein